VIINISDNDGSSEQELIICVPLTCGPSVGYVTEFGVVYCGKARDSPGGHEIFVYATHVLETLG
jgi:hypothetical protein